MATQNIKAGAYHINQIMHILKILRVDTAHLKDAKVLKIYCNIKTNVVIIDDKPFTFSNQEFDKLMEFIGEKNQLVISFKLYCDVTDKITYSIEKILGEVG